MRNLEVAEQSLASALEQATMQIVEDEKLSLSEKIRRLQNELTVQAHRARLLRRSIQSAQEPDKARQLARPELARNWQMGRGKAADAVTPPRFAEVRAGTRSIPPHPGWYSPYLQLCQMCRQI
jgi:hypothetical protein